MWWAAFRTVWSCQMAAILQHGSSISERCFLRKCKMLITKTAFACCACWWNTELRGTPSVSPWLLECVQQSFLSSTQRMGSETHSVGYKEMYCRSCAGLTQFTLQWNLSFVYFFLQILCILTLLQATWKHLHEQSRVQSAFVNSLQFPYQWQVLFSFLLGKDTWGVLAARFWGANSCSLISKLNCSVEGISVSKFFSNTTKKYPLRTWIAWNNYVVFLSFGPLPASYQGDSYCRLYLEAKCLHGASDNVTVVPLRKMYTAWNALLWAERTELQIAFSCVFRQCSVKKCSGEPDPGCWWYSVDSGTFFALQHLSDFYLVILSEV